jgi:glycosyltransferase involved in cell wall biosynthesis
LRILHVVATVSPAYGGPAVSTPATCVALASRGHDVELWCTDWGPGPDGRAQRVGLENVDGYRRRIFQQRSPRQWTRSPDLAAAARRLVKKFDIVEVHGIYHHHSMAVSRACQRSGTPYVLRPYGSYDAYHRQHHALRKRVYEALIDNRNMRAAAFIRCTSEREESGVKALGFRRTVIVPLGLDVDSHTQRDRAHDQQLQLLFLGRISAKKNVPLLLSAFARLQHGSVRHHRLVIAGPVEERLQAPLRAQIDELGLADSVSMLGLVAGQSKADALRSANVFVLPSDDESFGLAALEAAGAGLAVVVSPDVAVGQDLAARGAALVSEKSIGPLSEVLSALAADPVRRTAIGHAAQHIAMSDYSWAAVATRLEVLYKQAI